MRQTYSRSENATNPPHSIAWWAVKVVCGTLLIASLFLMTLYSIPLLFDFPQTLAQGLVIVGGMTTLWHYRILKRHELNLLDPDKLIESKGLFRWVRHPMYAGDLLSYTGLALLAPNIVILGILIVSYLALVKQAKIEDTFLARRFGTHYDRWKSHTGSLMPRL